MDSLDNNPEMGLNFFSDVKERIKMIVATAQVLVFRFNLCVGTNALKLTMIQLQYNAINFFILY